MLYVKVICCNIYRLLYVCAHFWRDNIFNDTTLIFSSLFLSLFLFFPSPLILLVSWALFLQTRWIITGSYHSLSTTWLRKRWVIPIIFICVKRHDNYEKYVWIFSTCHIGGCRFSTFSNEAISARLCMMEADSVA